MYCSLEDAFPDVAPGNKRRATCWQKEQEPIVGAQVTRSEGHFYNHSDQSNGKEAPRLQHFAQQQPSHEQVCINSIHHCLSCAACQRLLWLHFQNHQPTITGAHVVAASPQPQARQVERRRPVLANNMGAQVQSASPVSVLNQPVSVGSSLTWGHLLVIFAGASFLLLIIERLRK